MNTNIDLSGSLSFLNLGELLNLLGTNGSTGVLHIKSSHASQPGSVYLDKGNPINATNGSLTGLDAVFALFGWTEGEFEFSEEDVTCTKTITKSRMEIILDGLRLLDEGKINKLGQSAAADKQPESPVKSGQLPLIKGPLVDYSYIVDEEGFYDGDEIVQEGNHGDWIWVILEGTAEIIKQAEKGPIQLLRIGDGAFLGSVAALISGAVVTESIFAWPGIGRLLVDSLIQRDYPTTQTVIFFAAAFIVFINILVDVMYAWLDPRIRVV